MNMESCLQTTFSMLLTNKRKPTTTVIAKSFEKEAQYSNECFRKLCGNLLGEVMFANPFSMRLTKTQTNHHRPCEKF